MTPRMATRAWLAGPALVVLLLAVATTPAAAREGEPPAAQANSAQAPLLVNQRAPAPDLLTGGAPIDAAGYQALAASGVHTFVDLRSAEEITPEIERWIADAGLVHVRIPIADENDLDLGAARELAALLGDSSTGSKAVVCRTGNRSGALLALEAHWIEGLSAEEALTRGLEAGLTRFEPPVRQLLGLPPLELQPAEPTPGGEASAKP